MVFFWQRLYSCIHVKIRELGHRSPTCLMLYRKGKSGHRDTYTWRKDDHVKMEDWNNVSTNRIYQQTIRKQEEGKKDPSHTGFRGAWSSSHLHFRLPTFELGDNAFRLFWSTDACYFIMVAPSTECNWLTWKVKAIFPHQGQIQYFWTKTKAICVHKVRWRTKNCKRSSEITFVWSVKAFLFVSEGGDSFQCPSG